MDYALPDEARHFPVTALSRATNADLVLGNQVELQFDGPATFESWLAAIESAERCIHFENYVVRNDRTGRLFRDALIAKAEQGVAVHVVYDWVGCWATPRRYWRPLKQAGGQVRAFNPPSLRDPFGVLQRDHRKLVCVDNEVAFIGGFCVGDEWAGSPDQPPWRDTGVALKGPAAAEAARTFEAIWRTLGEPISPNFQADPNTVPAAGDSAVWVIRGIPWRSRVYRATHLVTASAQSRIWITDPYFVAPRPVSEALAAAAKDGVDVRILVPAHNNWPWVGSLSRGGYRPLLRAGVRIFEWQGPMIHAKTSVADGVWCRIGSSNLNAASLLGNWEIDVGVLDWDLARQMEGLFLADLASSVEIVLPGQIPRRAVDREGVAPVTTPIEAEGTLQDRIQYWRHSPGAGSGWRLADLVRAGSTLGDAIAGHRTLGREDRTVLGTVTIALLLLGGLAAIVPRFAGWTVSGLLLWLGVTLGLRAAAQARRARATRNTSGESGVRPPGVLVPRNDPEQDLTEPERGSRGANGD